MAFTHQMPLPNPVSTACGVLVWPTLLVWVGVVVQNPGQALLSNSEFVGADTAQNKCVCVGGGSLFKVHTRKSRGPETQILRMIKDRSYLQGAFTLNPNIVILQNSSLERKRGISSTSILS